MTGPSFEPGTSGSGARRATDWATRSGTGKWTLRHDDGCLRRPYVCTLFFCTHAAYYNIFEVNAGFSFNFDLCSKLILEAPIG